MVLGFESSPPTELDLLRWAGDALRREQFETLDEPVRQEIVQRLRGALGELVNFVFASEQVQMIKFLVRKGKYLDLLFDAEGEKLLAEDLTGLLGGLWVERSADMHKVAGGSAKVALCLTLGDDDFIDIKSNSISLILDRKTCEYAATKLKAFVATDSMFPAELQSFESVGNRGNVMVYFFAAYSYGTNG